VAEAEDPEATTLELDELWSFVLKKARKRWMWIALCRKTRQVVAYFIGDRSQSSCQQLWGLIPALIAKLIVTVTSGKPTL
jgi:IS1 family transposase